MRATFALVAFAVLAAAEPVPGGVSSAIAPSSSPPPGCSPNYDGEFEIAPANVSHDKRDLIMERQHTQLAITLKNGILTDTFGRTGYIASNQQFQFDDPPQAGAIWTAGFSVCPNTTLALGSDVVWERCLSGTFYNLYLHNSGGQCIESYILARAVGDGHPVPVSTTASSSAPPASSSAPSSSAPVSSSSVSVSGTGHAHHKNATASISSSSMNVTISSSSSTSVKHTTKHTAQHTTSPPHKSPAKSSSSSSASSSSTGAAEPVGVRGEMFGLAAGLLAFAMI